ncbi:hypothetical protein EJ06DRAFT_585709 [Trichodelitschia bisporula]|uniref:Uncharacterized protein n=1 Tax=Trichodelitschia bisporula TaxID=703511 RepID=A0A6G1HIS8_9PEZI|nr:hypothetical protein EJ06DRAFT_585709 [Trichodelitschia bisporula]
MSRHNDDPPDSLATLAKDAQNVISALRASHNHISWLRDALRRSQRDISRVLGALEVERGKRRPGLRNRSLREAVETVLDVCERLDTFLYAEEGKGSGGWWDGLWRRLRRRGLRKELFRARDGLDAAVIEARLPRKTHHSRNPSQPPAARPTGPQHPQPSRTTLPYTPSVSDLSPPDVHSYVESLNSSVAQVALDSLPQHRREHLLRLQAGAPRSNLRDSSAPSRLESHNSAPAGSALSSRQDSFSGSVTGSVLSGPDRSAPHRPRRPEPRLRSVSDGPRSIAAHQARRNELGSIHEDHGPPPAVYTHSKPSLVDVGSLAGLVERDRGFRYGYPAEEGVTRLSRSGFDGSGVWSGYSTVTGVTAQTSVYAEREERRGAPGGRRESHDYAERGGRHRRYGELEREEEGGRRNGEEERRRRRVPRR